MTLDINWPFRLVRLCQPSCHLAHFAALRGERPKAQLEASKDMHASVAIKLLGSIVTTLVASGPGLR